MAKTYSLTCTGKVIKLISYSIKIHFFIANLKTAQDDI